MCLLHQNTDSAEELIPPCTLHFVNDMELHVAAFNTTDQRVTYLKKFATYHTWVSVNPQDSNYSCSDPVIGDNPLPTNKLLLIFPLPLYCFFFFLENCQIVGFKHSRCTVYRDYAALISTDYLSYVYHGLGLPVSVIKNQSINQDVLMCFKLNHCSHLAKLVTLLLDEGGILLVFFRV